MADNTLKTETYVFNTTDFSKLGMPNSIFWTEESNMSEDDAYLNVNLKSYLS